MSDVESKVKNIVKEKLELSIDEVDPESKLVDDLEADSLQYVDLILAIEEEFGIDIPDEEAEKFVKVSDIIEYVRNNL